jgi:predicted kinase
MCGLPGSGKTTNARLLETETPAVRLCPDEWLANLEIDPWDEQFRERLERQFWTLAQELLRHDTSVILESGFWLRSDRDEKRLGGQALGASVEIVVLDVPFDELVRRLALRNTALAPGFVSISREQLADMVPFFDLPGPDELALFDRVTFNPGA